jgi:hypothetical protein
MIEEKQRTVVGSLRAALEGELAGTSAEESPMTRGQDVPAYARALALVAGDAMWDPAED